MYINTNISEKEYKKTQKRIKKIKDIITLFIIENKGNISKKVKEIENAFYFGKYSKKDDKYRLLVNYKLEEIENHSYEEYLLIKDKFIKEWEDINQIIVKGGE